MSYEYLKSLFIYLCNIPHDFQIKYLAPKSAKCAFHLIMITFPVQCIFPEQLGNLLRMRELKVRGMRENCVCLREF